jgi:hypothetical protein
MFSSGFLEFLVLGGLIWTGAGVAVLMFLLLKDWKNKQLW